jgi:hypothetical protein
LSLITVNLANQISSGPYLTAYKAAEPRHQLLDVEQAIAIPSDWFNQASFVYIALSAVAETPIAEMNADPPYRQPSLDVMSFTVRFDKGASLTPDLGRTKTSFAHK